MRLLVARHGATSFNVEQRIQGQTDIPLNELGLLQADALAQRLREKRFNVIVSSDLLRAQVTAMRIAAALEKPVEIDTALREINMGEWEGQFLGDVKQHWGAVFEQFSCDPLGEIAAPGGESWATFTERIDGALSRWKSRYPAGKVLWVAHGGVMSALLLRALNLRYDQRRQFVRGNASLLEINYRPEGAFIYRMNDTAHLDHLPRDMVEERVQAL